MKHAFVGRAFRGKDGVVRWITGLSTLRNYQLLWLRPDGTWATGGVTPAASFTASMYFGDEVVAPQPGETYKLANVFSGYREVKV